MCVKSLLKFCGCIAVCSALLLTLCPLSAEAALSGGRYMSPSETLQVFGSEISFEYFNGSDYTSGVFLYDSTDSIQQTYGALPDNWSDYSGATFLRYVASTSGLNTDPNYITVNISPSYSIFDTEQITSLIALSSVGNYGRVSNIYQSPSWDWVIGGESYHFENSRIQSGGFYSQIRFSDAGSAYQATFVPMQFVSQSSTSGYSSRAVFSGNNGDTMYLFIACPYVSADAEGSHGIFTQTSADNSNVNVSVNVDMRETNSILSGIAQTILDGLSSLFVPDSDYVQDKIDRINSRFGIFHSISQTWDTVFGAIQAQEWGTPPTVTVNMANRSEGGYGFDYGGTVSVFDLSWYTEYKQLGDTIISAFLWLFFLWRLYARLPDIVSGAGMVHMKLDDGGEKMKNEKG